jgi:hypothetical protein
MSPLPGLTQASSTPGVIVASFAIGTIKIKEATAARPITIIRRQKLLFIWSPFRAKRPAEQDWIS